MTATLEADWRDWPLEAKLRLRRAAWHRAARPEQRLPEGDWRIWYLQGGRGSGKTRGAAEAFAELIDTHDEPGAEWAVIAPTYGDGRDVCIEGPSGLLQALGLPRWFDGWNRSMGELQLPSGGIVYVDGADDGALRVQGKNLLGAWCDEVGLWRRWDIAWRESVAFAVRLAPAKIIASGTPKEGHGLVRLLIEDESIPKSRMRTSDNLANLSEHAIAELQARYAGTRRGLQELEGEFLTDTPGALWTAETIEKHRIKDPALCPDFERVVVAVDPAVTSGEESDETGIVVVGTTGRDEHQRFYVLEDATLRGTPDQWANEAVACYDEYQADKIVAEVNNGGDLVGRLIRSVWSKVNYGDVRATRGKQLRAEPVAGLYEQGRVHHVGSFPELEEQMTSWTQGAAGSPDRLDALVWAVTELETNAPRKLRFRGAA